MDHLRIIQSLAYRYFISSYPLVPRWHIFTGVHSLGVIPLV